MAFGTWSFISRGVRQKGHFFFSCLRKKRGTMCVNSLLSQRNENGILMRVLVLSLFFFRFFFLVRPQMKRNSIPKKFLKKEENRELEGTLHVAFVVLAPAAPRDRKSKWCKSNCPGQLDSYVQLSGSRGQFNSSFHPTGKVFFKRVYVIQREGNS